MSPGFSFFLLTGMQMPYTVVEVPFSLPTHCGAWLYTRADSVWEECSPFYGSHRVCLGGTVTVSFPATP